MTIKNSATPLLLALEFSLSPSVPLFLSPSLSLSVSLSLSLFLEMGEQPQMF